VHRGAIEMEFGNGSTHRLEKGAFARVDASTVRRIPHPWTTGHRVCVRISRGSSSR